MIAFGRVIASMEYRTPCVPMPLALTPRNGKWSGPRSVLLLICTVPTSNRSAMENARLMSLVNTEECNPYSERFASPTAWSMSFTRITGKIGAKGSFQATSISSVTRSNRVG